VFTETGAPQDSSATLTGGATTAGTRAAPGEKVYTGEPIDLRLKDADIKDVLRTFAQLTGLNIAIDPNVTGTVTVEFDDVPWDQALDIILRQNGLTYSLSGNVMRVGTIQSLAAEEARLRTLEADQQLNVPLQTVIKHLSYAKANNVKQLLDSMASKRGQIEFDTRTNQIIITEIPSYLSTMLNLIETIDIPTPQVVIEARVVETTKTFARSLGIRWNFSGLLDPALGTGTGLVFPSQVSAIGGPFNFAAGNPVLQLTLGNVLGTFDLDVTLTAAENEGLARIISAPKVVTQDNEAAEIQSGVQIPIQTRVNNTTTVTYVDATLRLSVTPQITNADTVIMEITVQKTEPSPGISLSGAANVPLITRRATTKLMVRDGGTAVIGGIYQATDNRGQERLPFVSDIPVIGNLFKSRTISSRHDELLIFITPRIVRNA
jgi:type IV pilus assembly protein PilQ